MYMMRIGNKNNQMGGGGDFFFAERKGKGREEI